MPPAKEYGATSTGGSAAGFQEFDDFDDPFEQPPAPKQRARPTAAPVRPKPASRRSLPPPVPQAAEEEEEERPQRKASSARSLKKAGDKKRKRCAVPARTHMAVMGGVAVVLCVAFFMFKAPSTGTGPSRMGAMLISLGLRGPSFPSNVLVTGCGLGNRLVSVGSFLEAGKEAGQTAGIVWGTSVAMSAQWSELFKTPLPEVKPAELAKTNYRWTSTEYAKDPLAVRTLANGRSFKSSTGHYAELAGLDDAKFSALPIESKPKVGGWAGLTPANTLTSVAKGDVSISVGCMARKFGTTPNSFLQTLEPIDSVNVLVDAVAATIAAKKTAGQCRDVVGLHLRRGDLERATQVDHRKDMLMSDANLVAALKTWPVDICFMVATDKHDLINVVTTAVGAGRVVYVVSEPAANATGVALSVSQKQAATALSNTAKAADMVTRKEVHGMQLAVADMFALGKTSAIYAQPPSTYSLAAAWIANIPISEFQPTYGNQTSLCTAAPSGLWGKTKGLKYPVQCWKPAPAGAEPAATAAEAEAGAEAEIVEADGEDAAALPASGNSAWPKEAAMCQSLGGILHMGKKDVEGTCCLSSCGSVCGIQGCGGGGGGAKACCRGTVAKTGAVCHKEPGPLAEHGCKMVASTLWTNLTAAAPPVAAVAVAAVPAVVVAADAAAAMAAAAVAPPVVAVAPAPAPVAVAPVATMPTAPEVSKATATATQVVATLSAAEEALSEAKKEQKLQKSE